MLLNNLVNCSARKILNERADYMPVHIAAPAGDAGVLAKFQKERIDVHR